MPTGPAHWHEFWGGDERPMAYLRSRGYTFSRGGMISPPPGQRPDQLDGAAIDYLCEEWDYGYKGEMV